MLSELSAGIGPQPNLLYIALADMKTDIVTQGVGNIVENLTVIGFISILCLCDISAE
jgi:hypothetical protein